MTADFRRPSADLRRLLDLARERYGVEGEGEDLPSERDRNARVTAASGERYVVRLSSPDEDPGLLDLQQAVLERLEPLGSTPRVLPDRDGRRRFAVLDDAGASCQLRLFSWVDGRPFAQHRPHGPALWRSAGRLLARVDGVLATMEHPAGRRDFSWDLARAAEVIEARRPSLDDAAQRARVDQALAAWRTRVLPRLGQMPHQLLHNDANDWNLLVGRSPEGEWTVQGLIDFGDMVHSARVHELAIAAAYLSLGQGRPQHAAAALVAGYHELSALSELEVALLPTLIALRLAQSVATSAWRRSLGLGDPYLSISEAQAWRALEAWQALADPLAVAFLRVALGWTAHPCRSAVVGHLRATPAASPVDVDLRREPVARLDLSVASADLAELEDENDPAQIDALCRRLEREAGARVSAGGYGEARPIYLSDAFALPGSPSRERRTVHLGVDLWQPAGSPIFAPLAGKLHSFADNAEHGDYGPTLILEHQAADGVPFYSLYGHLSRASLQGKAEGQTFAAGDRLGWLGAAAENGGWAPHLHFQLMLDPLGQRGQFFGVAAPSERAVWLGLCPDPNLVLGIPQEALAAPQPSPAKLRARRDLALGRNLSLSYAEPLHIVRGRGAYLIDAEGRAFLDTVNNVACVGHQHPRVGRALRRQMALLNTNTRYLHEGILRYAEKLASTLPAPLSVCFFVNSGSEAGELAWRIARTATGGGHALVVDGAYHGNTSAMVELSPYKFAGPGGAGKKAHVEVLPMPDPYRDPEAGARAGKDVAAALAAIGERGGRPVAFFCESVLSCGGQIVLPDGYLATVYAAVRAAGGVCVADEVQTGVGRAGRFFWAFESQGVVPDIVTAGKPLGNGFPLAAVFTTPALAAAFANGMEYFNTFGGNAAACAVGEAVLDVIEDEGLQRNAAEVGDFVLAGLHALASRHPLIGDVRGLGLFLGIELVTDRATKTPAPRQTRYLVERLKALGILMSIDGPHHNVLKIKPPLVFSPADAERLLEALDTVLAEQDALPS